LWWASVVASDAVRQKIVEWANANHAKVNFPVPVAEALGLINRYEPPSSLGIDRYMGLMAARQHQLTQPKGVAWLVVNVGTAITMDLLSAEGEFLGGTISAGLHLQRHALASNTANLPTINPDISLPAFPSCANTTESAIAVGTIESLLGAIYWRAMRCKPQKIVLCGGDSPLLHARINAHSMPWREWQIALQPQLIFEGLRFWALAHAKELP
jgi:type III pantothenate kinase